MKIREHLLVCLNEEAVEIAHHVDKALRFGLSDHDPTVEGAQTEAERIREEFADLIAVYDLLIANGTLMAPSSKLIEDKKGKLNKFMGYARERGTLE